MISLIKIGDAYNVPIKEYEVDEASELNQINNAPVGSMATVLKNGKVYKLRDEGWIEVKSGGINPTGTLEINSNGNFNVTQYAEASVNIPTANLNEKTITTNGLYNASDDQLDGYNKVLVNTNPNIGFVFTDFDENGFPHSLRTYGYTTLPNDFFTGVGAGNYNRTLHGSRLESVFINEGLTRLGNSSLRDMNRIKEIHFPSSLTTIGNYVWFGDVYLELLDFSQCIQIPSLDIGNGLPSGCVIRVPQALLADWQEETNWVEFENVIWEGV